MRYKAIVSYDGTNYQGWQKQPDKNSVQAKIEAALSRLCRQEIKITGAGRTDKGVHAFGQVFILTVTRNSMTFASQLTASCLRISE